MSNFDGCAVAEFLLTQEVTLHFDIDVLGPEDVQQALNTLASPSTPPQRKAEASGPSLPPVRQIRPFACSWSSSSKTAPSFLAARSFIFVMRRQRFW